MGMARTKRLMLICVQTAKENKTHWLEEFPNSLISMYSIRRCFNQLYEAGKVNTADWWDDGIELM